MDPCVIIIQVPRIETSHFCVIKCSKDTNTAFYVAEVISNNSDNNTVAVQWWAPNAIAKQKDRENHNIAFKACTNKHREQNCLHNSLDTLAILITYCLVFQNIHKILAFNFIEPTELPEQIKEEPIAKRSRMESTKKASHIPTSSIKSSSDEETVSESD